ncbi:MULTISPECIES: membrane integrity-associated transporter subunit PqiC [Raoultella]|uniref:PqiC family protein n=1 Tax=Raoultella TaxID=160674 RepID=UPI002169E78D|nr:MULTISPECIES: PqiC family protein [Raoultella]MCS4271755.1 putative lipoprotein YmbA [Raoultella sp. BIGb0132]MCS4287936.1 putative lipoprotein YmbA [Raoultella terrigena]
MKLLPFFFTLAMIFAINGCSSPPIGNHTLQLPAPPAGPAKRAAFVVELLPIGVPAPQDIKQVVIRQSDSSMLVLDNDRWLSPLSEEMHSALSPQIAQRLGTLDVSGLSKTDEQQRVRIQIQIRRFDLWPGNRVRLDADWSLSARSGDQRRRLLCQSQLTLSAPDDYLQLFPLAQRLVNQLAIAIADTAEEWADSARSTCR